MRETHAIGVVAFGYLTRSEALETFRALVSRSARSR